MARDVADGLVRLADTSGLSRTVYNLGSGRLGSAETWCEALARVAPRFRWRRARAGETGNVDSHTGFHRGPMAIGKIARDTGFAPLWEFEAAAQEWVGWLG